MVVVTFTLTHEIGIYYVMEFYKRALTLAFKFIFTARRITQGAYLCQVPMGLSQLALPPYQDKTGTLKKGVLLWDEICLTLPLPALPPPPVSSPLSSTVCSEGFNKYRATVSKAPVRTPTALPLLNLCLKHDVFWLLKHSRDFQNNQVETGGDNLHCHQDDLCIVSCRQDQNGKETKKMKT